MSSKPVIIGHKGANKIAPENTLKSFTKAIELKADYIEFDVHESKDGEIVIIHDANTLEATGLPGLVKEMTLMELKTLDFGEGESIPTLKELIEVTKGKIKLNCEVKTVGLASKLVKFFREVDLIETTIISSFIYSELLKIHSIDPEVKLGMLLHKDVNSNRSLKKWITKISKNNFYSIHPEWSSIDHEFVQIAHEHNLKVLVYTINEKKDMENLLNFGVDGLITDDISLAKEVLGRI